ncbi:hypothetical protein [Vannielia litorea]|uniref:hypothetical protein n=1 Tax=Vannielia litorea TaxID=1217970 RepID=UPI001C974FCB|nr:hypothetical protein [Vannielia litorea]MBY6046598.1 hypothetical protein [Vannielia litorea]MBY6074012.1 hypothetical protein [Vannielia litorea]
MADRPIYGPGHNGGPTMEPGAGWRGYAWKRARAELLPSLPLPVIQRRLKRAGELGLDFKTYARVHHSAGRDIVAILFSNNALRMIREGQQMPEARAAKLRDLARCGRGLLAHAPQDPAVLAMRIEAEHAIHFDPAATAPDLRETWGQTRARIRSMLNGAGLLPGAVVLVGDTPLEADWAPTANLAGHVSADQYFGP